MRGTSQDSALFALGKRSQFSVADSYNILYIPY